MNKVKQQLGLGVNILLKDGTYLANAVIFPDDSIGIRSLMDENDIKQKFENYVEYGFIYFQTALINGKFHPINVKWYEIINIE